MDLGVYTVYAAHRLFGAPETASYTAQQLPNSLDLNGSGTLFYPDFQVRVEAGKNIHSNLPAEIYTADGTLTLDGIEYIQSAVFCGHDGKEFRLPIQPEKRKMTGQVATFAEIIQQKDQTAYQELADMANNVHQTLWTMRQSAGIAFEGENNEN